MSPLSNMPSPQTFTILPDIHALLTRLELLKQPVQDPHNQSQQPASPQATDSPSIRLSDLATATHPIRQKIAKARATVEALPDIDRTVEEQEDEIQGLKTKITALGERLKVLARLAGEASNLTEIRMDDMQSGGKRTGVEEGEMGWGKQRSIEDVNMAGA